MLSVRSYAAKTCTWASACC